MDYQVPTEPPEPDPDPDAAAESVETGPVADSKTPLVTVPLTEDQIGSWFNEIQASIEIRTRVEKSWEVLLKAYTPEVTEKSQDVKSGLHFRNVHAKKSKMFVKLPELTVTAKGQLLDKVLDPMTGAMIDSSDVAVMVREILNDELGIEGIDAARMVGECLFDVLAWTGAGWSYISYKNAKKMVQDPIMGPDPNFVPPPPQPGSILGLASPSQPPMVPQIDPMTGQPMMGEPHPVVIWEKFDWEHLSAKKGLLPAGLKSTRFDKDAEWIGHEIFMTEEKFRREFQIDASVELQAGAAEDDRVYQHADLAQGGVKDKKLLHGYMVFYRASCYSTDEVNPDVIWQLVLLENVKDKVFVHRLDPDQSIDDQGRLTADSRVGYPYVIFTNRDYADSPYPIADTGFTNNSVKNVNTHRQQSVALRDANIGKMLFDTGAFTQDEIEAFKSGTVGSWIGVQPGKLSQGLEKIMAPILRSEASRDDWRTAQVLKQDVEDMIGLGGPNVGAQSETARTATEIATMSGSSNERMEDEQTRILGDYLRGVTKFLTLIQRWADERSFVNWVGKDGLMRVSSWDRHMIAAKWSLSAKPNSQLRLDAKTERSQLKELLTELAPLAIPTPMAPAGMVNLKPLVRKLANFYDIDPKELINPDMPSMGLGPMPGMPGAPPMPMGLGDGPGGPGKVAPGPPKPGDESKNPPGAPSKGAIPNAPTPNAGTPQVQNSLR